VLRRGLKGTQRTERGQASHESVDYFN
jgi:hypothetical protein